MKEILEKISSYNLFNYFLPGVLFVAISNKCTDYNFVFDNELIGVFVYYFIGMIISRMGSIIIEPILKKIRFVKFADYKLFVSASRKDEKIELFSEINNTYRTIIAMVFLLLVLKAYNHLQVIYSIPNNSSVLFAMILILAMFLFSYRKQTTYLTKRIEANNKPNNE